MPRPSATSKRGQVSRPKAGQIQTAEGVVAVAVSVYIMDFCLRGDSLPSLAYKPNLCLNIGILSPNVRTTAIFEETGKVEPWRHLCSTSLFDFSTIVVFQQVVVRRRLPFFVSAASFVVACPCFSLADDLQLILLEFV